MRPCALQTASGWRSKRAKNGWSRTSFCGGRPLRRWYRKFCRLSTLKRRAPPTHGRSPRPSNGGKFCRSSTLKRRAPPTRGRSPRPSNGYCPCSRTAPYICQPLQRVRRGRRSREHLGGAFPDGYDHFHRLHALFRGVSTKRSGKSKLRLVAYGGRFLLPFYSPISPQSPVFSQNRAKGQCIKIKNMHDFVLFIHKIVIKIKNMHDFVLFIHKIVHKLADHFVALSNFPTRQVKFLHPCRLYYR